MSEDSYQIPEIPDIEAAYRSAHRALEGILDDGFGFVPEADLDANGVFSQFPLIAEEADASVAARLGPRISWQTECRSEFDLTIAGVDFDNGGRRDFGAKLNESVILGPDGWSGSPLDRAARTYRRECGWDFSPAGSGIWVLMLAPTSGSGADGEWSYEGHLVGFVILHDRDEDSRYESVAHMWTARSWRRKGIAIRLLNEAKTRFEFREIEGPLTDDSAALLEAHPQFSD